MVAHSKKQQNYTHKYRKPKQLPGEKRTFLSWFSLVSGFTSGDFPPH
jgi:hypothetical protein